MKALLLRNAAPIETAPLEPAEIPVPEPGDREILIRVRACGLCHTDLHTVEGELALPKMPLVPGHQIVGVVQEVGEGVSRLGPGDRVGLGWLNSACGECAFCRSERENLCLAGRFTGYHVDGGYAEYVVAPAAFTYPLPQGFSDEQAAPLLCGGVIGYRALRLSGIRPGEVLGLYGFGASAHIVIQVARYWGCRVLVFTRSAAHRELAGLLGAAWAGRAEDTPPEEPDSSIIFAPAGNLVPLALGRLKPGGTLALAGITMSPIPEMPYDLLYGERTVRSVANATRRDALDLLALAAEVPVKTRVRVFDLTGVNRALHLLKQGRINAAGVVRVATD